MAYNHITSGLTSNFTIASTQNDSLAPPQPTRFESCINQMEQQLAALSALTGRLNLSLDRLGGPIPEDAGKPANPRSTGNLAARLECNVEDFEGLLRRVETLVTRIEHL